MKKYFRIGDLARMCGVSPRTIDYYTRLGLISPWQRSSGMHRLYDEDAVQQLRRIKELQAQRLTLVEIASRLEAYSGKGSCADALPRLRYIEEELARLDREVASLQPELAGLAMSDETRPAAVRTISAAIASAMALANHLSNTLL